ncbi:sulfite exporter TauE/SafE family protein [Fulvivirga sediminis]|uniref:Probable membrane transporter protein n=1 Tax=Fulvivirga sediminis TaxID=2803949 RepID=A0A937FAU8_9BACT|nr:sulfite exporter TauE/SafE family protein [Fulvivirga sediminis]MBL3658531.1 sulfite exporter TauE/SafE family protein [Fulvivirga sediminis]
MEIFLGYMAAVLIGLSLGLTGGGGSILTVPMLVYILGVNPTLATGYSLFVVGVTAGVGAISAIRKKVLEYKPAILFAVPSIIAVFFTRKFLIPAIPHELGQVFHIAISKDLAIMVLFAILMIAASISMIRSAKSYDVPSARATKPLVLMIVGAVVGFVAGLVGAGGGFLIIPALVLLAGMPMKPAVGTSLLIISSQSLIGFIGDATEQSIDWLFLIEFSLLAIVGIFIGMYWSRKIAAHHLKSIFGWFVLVMGVYILISELLF